MFSRNLQWKKLNIWHFNSSNKPNLAIQHRGIFTPRHLPYQEVHSVMDQIPPGNHVCANVDRFMFQISKISFRLELKGESEGTKFSFNVDVGEANRPVDTIKSPVHKTEALLYLRLVSCFIHWFQVKLGPIGKSRYIPLCRKTILTRTNYFFQNDDCSL